MSLSFLLLRNWGTNSFSTSSYPAFISPDRNFSEWNHIYLICSQSRAPVDDSSLQWIFAREVPNILPWCWDCGNSIMVLSEVKGYHKWETEVGGSERLQIYLSWKRNWWWFITMPIVVYIKGIWDSCVDSLPAYVFRKCLCFSPASKGYILNVCLVLIFDISMIQNLARNSCLHFVKVWLAYGFWLLGIGLEMNVSASLKQKDESSGWKAEFRPQNTL